MLENVRLHLLLLAHCLANVSMLMSCQDKMNKFNLFTFVKMPVGQRCWLHYIKFIVSLQQLIVQYAFLALICILGKYDLLTLCKSKCSWKEGCYMMQSSRWTFNFFIFSLSTLDMGKMTYCTYFLKLKQLSIFVSAFFHRS